MRSILSLRLGRGRRKPEKETTIRSGCDRFRFSWIAQTKGLETKELGQNGTTVAKSRVARAGQLAREVACYRTPIR